MLELGIFLNLIRHGPGLKMSVDMKFMASTNFDSL